MTRRKLQTDQVILAAAEISSGADGVATRVQFVPMGAIKFPRDTRRTLFLRDKAHGEAVVAATLARLGSTDLVIDYDHQTVFAPKPEVGGRAPAAGWVSGFEVDDLGIWATVAWTDQAAAALAAREYRYLSPVIHADKATGDIKSFASAGLTNSPALDLAAVAASTHDTGDDMNLTAIAAALGLGADTTEAQIIAAIGTSKTPAIPAAICTALGLAETASETEVVVAAVAAKAGSTLDPATKIRLEAIETRETERIVDDAITCGKLTPALRDWGIKSHNRDAADFETYIAAAPVILDGKPVVVGIKDGGDDVLSEEEKVYCSNWGLSEAEFLASRKMEVAQ